MSATKTIRIFEMNDCDWMAAETLEEAKAAYLATVAGKNPTPREIEEFVGEAREVPDAALDRLTFHDDGDVRTFREELDLRIAEGHEFPCLFASTEY